MLFCRHDWELVSETITESALDALLKAGVTEFRKLTPIFAERKIIQILKCKKCGKLKRFAELV